VLDVSSGTVVVTELSATAETSDAVRIGLVLITLELIVKAELALLLIRD